MTGYFRAYSIRVREATRELEDRELRVYMALLSFADCRGLAWPGYKALCDLTGVCNDAVRDVLLTLAVKGYIDVVRKGARDPLTGQQWSNVYRIDGAVTDDPDCVDDEIEPPSLESSSTQDSYHHQSTQPVNTTKETQPETPPPPQQISSKVATPKDKSEEKAPEKAPRKAKTKTPTPQGVIPNSPPVAAAPPAKYYTGPLEEFAEALPDELERAAATIHETVERKITVRAARRLVAKYGQAEVDWALAHLAKQTDVYNPPGYITALLTRRAVEAADAEPIDPGQQYITGKHADYISH